MSELLSITLLSGLAHGGKSSLLANVLTQEHGMKMLALVETLAQIEAVASKCKDAQLVKPNQLEFPNGSMCLALAPRDLLQEVASLAKSGAYSCGIIADPGTSEPMKVATALTFAPLSLAHDMKQAGKQEQLTIPAAKGPDCELAQGKTTCSHGCCDDEGPTLMSVCSLDTCVTVLDASTLKADLTSIEELADRTPEGDQRSLATLLVEMVEFANVVIVNKCDLVTKTELSEIHELVAALNPCARIIEATHSAVKAQDIVRTRVFDLDQTSRSAGWLQARNPADAAQPKQKASKKGVTSFMYTARRPFHPGRLYRNFMRKFFLTRVIASESDESGSEEASDEEMQEQAHEEEKKQARGCSKELPQQEKECCQKGSCSKQEPQQEPQLQQAQCCTKGSCSEQEPQQQRQQQQQQQKKSTKEVHTSEESSGDEEEEDDEEMKEALADYAAARDTVLAASKRELGEVVRSKGFFWLATQHDSILGWDNVGALLQVMKEGCWFACVPEDEWPNNETVLKRIMADFSMEHPEIGDRRQEIAFIGRNLKEGAICSLLDSCLATEEEVAAAKEGKLRDELFGGEDEEGSNGSDANKEELTLEEAQELLNAKAATRSKKAHT